MPREKSKADDQSSADNQDLVKRVDAMMDPKADAKSVPQKIHVSSADTSDPAKLPPLDIFKGVKTAPKLTKEESVDKDKNEVDESADVAEPAKDSAEEAEKDDSKIDDADTDKAVDDIVANESDTILAVDDARAKKRNGIVTTSPSWKTRLKQIVKNKWIWIGVAAIIVVIFAIPLTRYKLLGLVIHEPVAVTVVDSQTNTPVSGAVVSIGGASAKTDAEGLAKLKVGTGSHGLSITKQYYKGYSSHVSVSLKAQTASVHLIATGRQVPLVIVNKISDQPLDGADIKVLNTTAKTGKNGQATVVLPAGNTTDQATVSLSGFNTATVKIQVTGKVVSANTIQLTPSGHVYFLSNASGNIDVVKTNLDGSDRQTILAGTDQENAQTTSLLASRDWRYLVLEAQRNGSQAALYLIDTSDDKVSAFDNSNASFQLIGWSGHDFIYDVTSNTTPQSQAGHEIIKSYDADHGQLNQLDQDQVAGSDSSYGYQSFSNFYLLNDQLAYTVQWFSNGGYDISSQNDSIRGIQPNGQSKKDYQTLSAASVNGIQASLYAPQTIYYAVYDNTGQTTYYNFANQSVSTASIDADAFNQSYPTYLVSPSGTQTFWTELRDGQNSLLTGDINAQHSKQIASLSDYSPYGWYTNNYVLVAKDSSQLFIMPATGLSSGQSPLKITDYYKPAPTYNGYSYGGL